MTTLTVRNLPEDLAEALERESARRGISLSRTVVELLGHGLGVEVTRSNGLARLAGSWTAEDFRRFEEATAAFEELDADV